MVFTKAGMMAEGMSIGRDGRGHVNQDKDPLKPPSPSDEPSGDKKVQIKSAFL